MSKNTNLKQMKLSGFLKRKASEIEDQDEHGDHRDQGKVIYQKVPVTAE